MRIRKKNLSLIQRCVQNFLCTTKSGSAYNNMIETNTTKKDNGFFGGCLLIGQISIARYTPQVVCQIIWMLSYWVRV